jgi:hypothetical protein
MTGWKDIIESVEARFAAQIETTYTVQVQYNNDGSFELDDENLGATNCWIRHFTMLGTDQAASLGPQARVRVVGYMHDMLFTPLYDANGESKLLTLADNIRVAFEGLTANGVTYRIPYRGNPIREDNWWRMDVFSPFYADRFVT